MFKMNVLLMTALAHIWGPNDFVNKIQELISLSIFLMNMLYFLLRTNKLYLLLFYNLVSKLEGVLLLDYISFIAF